MWRNYKARKTCLCLWCHEADLNHGVDEYLGKATDEMCCEDCGTDEDVHEVFILAMQKGA